MNYKAADLPPKQRAILGTALLTTASRALQSQTVKLYGTMAQ